MFRKYIICDRCGKRKSIQQEDTIADVGYSSLTSLTYDKRGDDRIKAYHLCDSCNNEFKEFMRIGGNTSEDE